jgi:hypothetical protein
MTGILTVLNAKYRVKNRRENFAHLVSLNVTIVYFPLLELI